MAELLVQARELLLHSRVEASIDIFRCTCLSNTPWQSRTRNPSASVQCFAKCPFTSQFDWLSDQLCQSLDRLSDHFAKHCISGTTHSSGRDAAAGGAFLVVRIEWTIDWARTAWL